MCLSFTEFVIDIPTRAKTASGLINFVFAILGLNVILCLVSVVMAKKQSCFPTKWLTKQEPEDDVENIQKHPDPS